MRGIPEGQSLRTIWLSEGYLLAGRVADARIAAQRALRLARQQKERGNEAYTLRLLGEIAAREDPPNVGQAEDHYRQAIALAEQLGMRPLVAHCHVGLGKLYRRMRNPQRAKEHLTTATEMMREMEMGLWLEKAEAELKELE
jgi:tetratricopeptide (TPR) repeat protein